MSGPENLAQRPRRTPNRPEIVAAQAELVAQLRSLWPEDDPTRVCWACGADDRSIERAHVVAHRHGGTCAPDNFFLLCAECHREQPDGIDHRAQVAWLLTRESRCTIDLRRYYEMTKRVVEMAERRGVPAEELSFYIQSKAFRVKMGNDPCLNPRNLPATLAAVEGVIADFLSLPEKRVLPA